jgi:hypothetical protein
MGKAGARAPAARTAAAPSSPPERTLTVRDWERGEIHGPAVGANRALNQARASRSTARAPLRLFRLSRRKRLQKRWRARGVEGTTDDDDLSFETS